VPVSRCRTAIIIGPGERALVLDVQHSWCPGAAAGDPGGGQERSQRRPVGRHRCAAPAGRREVTFRPSRRGAHVAGPKHPWGPGSMLCAELRCGSWSPMTIMRAGLVCHHRPAAAGGSGGGRPLWRAVAVPASRT